MPWEELGKTQVKIDPSQNAVQLTGSIATLDEPLPVLPLGSRTPRGEEVLNNITAFPQGELELQNRHTHSYPHRITSIGYDGVAYGYVGVDNDLFYTLDGANSIIRRGSPMTGHPRMDKRSNTRVGHPHP